MFRYPFLTRRLFLQAIAALYAVCSAPIEVCSEIVRQLSARVFPSVLNPASAGAVSTELADCADGAVQSNTDGFPDDSADASVCSGKLARLLFVLGQVEIR